MALRPQNVKKTVTCIPMAAAPVAMMNAAIARSMSPLSSTIVTLSGLEACRLANSTAGSICAIVMTPSFLSGPHEFGDFNGIFTIVSASFSCQGRGGVGWPAGLLCSRNARPRKALVGRAQWETKQTTPLSEAKDRAEENAKMQPLDARKER